MSKYTQQLTAEQLITYIATDHTELSYDKVVWQRDDWKNICREWLDYNLQEARVSEMGLDYKMQIEIETMEDYHDCETCGGNWAYGGVVTVDGKEVLRREPIAYCYGVPSFSEHDLLVMALKKINVEVTVDGASFEVCSHDDEYHGDELNENLRSFG